MNDFLEIQHLISMLMKRWWMLVLITAIAAVGGYFFSQRQPKVYNATTTVLVGQSIRSATLERVDIQTSQALAQTYVDMARRQPVLAGVVETLKLNESWTDLKKNVQVRLVPDTQLIEITVEANSPKNAEKIADEVAHQMTLISPSSNTDASSAAPIPATDFNAQQLALMQDRIKSGQKRLDQIAVEMGKPNLTADELLALQTEKNNLENLIVEWSRTYTGLLPFTISTPSRDPNQVSVIETAHSNGAPVRPNIQLNTALGAGLGLLLAIGLIFLLDFLDDTYKTTEDFAQTDEMKLLGSIGHIRGSGYAGKMVANLQPRSALTEAYRIIRSRLRFRPMDKSARTILVTSPLPGEGKTITVANLGVVFAQANINTIVVDADLRHPALHEVFNKSNDSGLGDLLESPETKLEDVLQDTDITHLRLLSSGKGLVDPSERLGSERMNEILAQLNQTADVVLFDCPPALVFADTIDLSRRMDGVVVVIRAGKSKRDIVNQVLFDLRNARANVLGSIFNDSPRSQAFGSASAYQDRSPFRLAGALRSRTQIGQAVRPAAQAGMQEMIDPTVIEGDPESDEMPGQIVDRSNGKRH
ncbi:MAG TPA: polysaccharide biosynthesis tyrosine autokinase [Anaerolineales bacterium]